MSWEDAEKLADEMDADGGDFIRLKDGDSVVGAIVGAPRGRKVVWDGQSTTDYNPDIHEGLKIKTRYAVPVYVPGRGTKTLEAGPKLFRDILTCRSKYGLDKWLFEFSRTGSTMNDTEYKCMPDRQIADIPGMADKIAAAATDATPRNDKVEDYF